MKNLTVGYAFCGSFCTLRKSVAALKLLKTTDINIIPIFSEIVSKTNTRFYDANELRDEVETICGNKIICNIPSAEPIGPKNLLDAIIVAPCTGNTASKIALGITDTSVTMAVKATLRNKKPVIIGIASNDALGASAKNIGILQNTKNIYFVPYTQDDPYSKNDSLVCDFSAIPDTLSAALQASQKQPILIR